ncbi:Hypothetical predicted protein [Octopus vulgaris]|uniref:Uncharacterized protein n=1 Tax=Octopus vulgaris TaxID=6645 RepID=A0AA36BVV3_OCTVU|nr:Hypothetical predicted protein [Octopus vulgaris]
MESGKSRRGSNAKSLRFRAESKEIYTERKGLRNAGRPILHRGRSQTRLSEFHQIPSETGQTHHSTDAAKNSHSLTNCCSDDGYRRKLENPRSLSDQKEELVRVSIELLIQMIQKNVDLIPDRIFLPGGSILPVRVDGRKAKFHVYFSTNHLKAFCRRRKEKERRAPLLPTPTTATRTPSTTAAALSPSADSAVAPATPTHTNHTNTEFPQTVPEEFPFPDAERVDITGGESGSDEEWKLKLK